MARRRVGLVYDERMCAHANPWDSSHPETPHRIKAIAQRLEVAGVFDRCIRVEAREASDNELTTVHTTKHVNLMRRISSKAYGKKEREKLANYYNSIYFNKGSSESALLAAGSVVELCVAVAKGDLEAGAAVVRPPGHHAEADSPMGFCLFNNVAVAAHVLVHEKHDLGIRKVLIVDWDVHHGNGTQHMFWDDDQVLYFSVHRYDNGSFYPTGTEGNFDKIGSDKAAGFNVNVPWPHGGFGDSDYLAVWNHVLLPIAKDFDPDIVLISGGFDSAEGDPLGGCCLTPIGYSEMTRKLTDLAKGRVILVLEGGYNLRSIAESYLACLQVLLGDSLQQSSLISKTTTSQSTWNLITKVRMALQEFWPVLHELSSDFHKEMDESMLVSKVDETLFQMILSDASSNNLEDVNSDVSEDHAPEFGASEHDIYYNYKSEAKIFNDLTDQVANLMINTKRFETTTGKEDTAELCRNEFSVGTSKVQCEDNVVSDHLLLNPIPEMTADNEQMYIWYASYGSNMWKDRFMCYLQGGQVETMKTVCLGSRNKAPPVDTSWMQVENQVFFGHSYSQTWGHGGVAFLEPKPTAGVSTHIHLYKIMLGQFNDLFFQENRILDYDRDLIKPDFVRALGQQALSSISTTLVKESWYGTILHLGEKDGVPILTFTCSPEDLDRFHSGLLPLCSPSEAYQGAVTQGLIEDLGLSKHAALAYVFSKLSSS